MNFLQPLPHSPIVDRSDHLVRAANGKRTLHVGCADSGLAAERMASDTLLHAALARTASDLWGVDPDAASVAALEAAGFENVLCGHAEDTALAIPEHYFDIVIAGDVIEHVSNAERFLSGLRRYIAPGGALVVSTPNAFRYTSLLFAMGRREFIHPDHVAWYSPITLTNILQRSGYRFEHLFLYTTSTHASVRPLHRPTARVLRHTYNFANSVFKRPLLFFFPYLADGLLALASPLPVAPIHNADV